jgi:hypothetical protein
MIKDQAIFNLYPSAVTVGNEGEFVLDKDQNPITIDEKKVEEEYKKLKAEYDALQYQRDRKYPKIAEQLDLIYWDKKNGTKKWEEAIDKVKADNPKPE